MSDLNRPASPQLRGRIRPAPDELVDPVDPAPRAAAEAPSDVPVAPPAADRPDDVSTASSPPAEVPRAEASAATEGPRVVSARRGRQREIVVPIGSRVSVEARNQLDDIAERENLLIRHALEKIIADYYHRT